MGTTLTALQSGGGRFVWVVAIEGYDTLLTSGDTDAVVTSWAATPWTAALSGLEVQLDIEQRIDPWTIAPEPGECRLRITPELPGKDLFGIRVHSTGAGNEAYLDTAIDVDDTTISTVNCSDFAAAGDAYIGVEMVSYTGNTGTDLTTVTRGKYCPFSRGALTTHVFGRPHPLPQLTADTALMPIVTDAPRQWVGKWVGVWLHRVVDGVVDTKAQAELVFAGNVEAIEDTEEGATLVHCVGVQERLNRTVLLHDQYRGKLDANIPIYGDGTLTISETYENAGTLVRNTTTMTFAATYVDQYTLEHGLYSITDLIKYLNEWLIQAGPDGDAELDNIYHFSLSPDSGRVVFSGEWPSDTAVLYFSAPRWLLVAMGYDSWSTPVVAFMQDNGSGEAHSMPTAALAIYDGMTLTVNAAQGTIWDNRDWLPAEMQALTASGDIWCVLKLGEHMVLAKTASAGTPTTWTNVKILYREEKRTKVLADWLQLYEAPASVAMSAGTEVKQVAMIAGQLVAVVSGLFASTGVSEYNGDYDNFASQLGASVPWELLGDNFVNSLTMLGATYGSGHLVVIDKPTPLWDAIGADMLLRSGYLVWRSGGLRWTTVQTPSSLSAVHNLTEATKASAQPADNQRTVTRIDDSLLRNVVKIEHSRATVDGEPTATTEIRHARSVADYGGERAQTITARNSYTLVSTDAGEIADLAMAMATRLMPIFGVPLLRVTLPISPAYYIGMAPGDLITVSDDHCREPTTGARGLSVKPGMVLEHRCSFGGGGTDGYGEVDVLLLPLDRTAVYSPSAWTDTWALAEVTVEDHEYSETSEAVDASHFAANDAVILVEVDPADPAAPDTLESTVDSVAGSVITLADSAAGLTGSYYRLIADTYTDADTQASQQTDCYLADSDDMEIAGERGPYSYADELATLTVAAPTPSDLCERHSNLYFGDGTADSVGVSVAMARNCNNLISYSLAAHGSYLFDAVHSEAVGEYKYVTHWPYRVGPPLVTWGYRELTIAPLYRSDTASRDVWVRVTVSVNPPLGTSRSGIYWTGPYYQATPWTTQSTTFATGTAATVPALCNARGTGYVTIEMQSDSRGGKVECWGLSKFWLGPVI